ncbi:MAG: hypothetical protein ACNI25_11360 [Halarcobacter sp.]
MINNNKEALLKDAVNLTLTQEEIEKKLKSNFARRNENTKEIEIEVTEPLSTKLKKGNGLIYILVAIIILLIGVTIYIW